MIYSPHFELIFSLCTQDLNWFSITSLYNVQKLSESLFMSKWNDMKKRGIMYTLAFQIEGNQLQFLHFSFYGIYTSLAHQTKRQQRLAICQIDNMVLNQLPLALLLLQMSRPTLLPSFQYAIHGMSVRSVAIAINDLHLELMFCVKNRQMCLQSEL